MSEVKEKLKLYSKEKLIDIIEKTSVEYAIKNQQYEFLRHNNISKELVNENNELQARINKAIDYIMSNHCLHLLDQSIINSKELIDILKGSDDNE